MKKLFQLLVILTLGFSASGSQQSLQDVSYPFDPSKIEQSENAFKFYRSFVPYYYRLIKNNLSQLEQISQISKVNGWCIGDAHPENFGSVAIQNNQLIFTVNDIDDSGPCPLGLDIVRFFVAAQIANPDVSIKDLIRAYEAGLNNQSLSIPDAINILLQDAFSKGYGPRKSSIDGKKLIRTDLSRELTESDKNNISQTLEKYFLSFSKKPTIIDWLEISKESGGSAGLLRYEILIQSSQQLYLIELKEEVIPAVAEVNQNIPTTSDRIQKTLLIVQNKAPLSLYQVVQMNGKDFLVRPRFSMDKGISLDKFSSDDMLDIFNYEAFVIGKIHRQSLSNNDYLTVINSIQDNSLTKEVELIAHFFELKYKELKQPNILFKKKSKSLFD